MKLVTLGCEAEQECCGAGQSEQASGTPQVVTGDQGPAGVSGAVGAAGRDGLTSFTSTTGSFINPDASGDVSIPVLRSAAFIVGQYIFVETAGYFRVKSLPTSAAILATSTASIVNALANTVISVGRKVSPGGLHGPDTPANAPKASVMLAIRHVNGENGGHVVSGSPGAYPFLGFPMEPNTAGITTTALVKIWDSENICTVSTGGFKLVPGTYRVSVRQSVYDLHGAKVFLFKTTDGLYTPSYLTQLTSYSAAETRKARGRGILTVTSAGDRFMLMVACQKAAGTTNAAFGIACNFDDENGPISETYALIGIEEF
jgi:hypothetical protein